MNILQWPAWVITAWLAAAVLLSFVALASLVFAAKWHKRSVPHSPPDATKDERQQNMRDYRNNARHRSRYRDLVMCASATAATTAIVSGLVSAQTPEPMWFALWGKIAQSIAAGFVVLFGQGLAMLLMGRIKSRADAREDREYQRFLEQYEDKLNPQ